METIKHILGFCGESHINIFTVILFIALVNGIEDAQNKKYPYHYDDLELEYENYSAYLSE